LQTNQIATFIALFRKNNFIFLITNFCYFMFLKHFFTFWIIQLLSIIQIYKIKHKSMEEITL